MEKQDSGVLLDETYVKMVQQKYEEAKQRSVGSSKLKISGEGYVGKNAKLTEFCHKAVKLIAGISIVAITGSLSYNGAVLSDYKEQVSEIVKEELEDDVILNVNYQNIQNLKDSSVLDDLREKMSILDDIKEEKTELKETGDYHFLDNKLYDDAIKKVAEERTYSDIEQAKNL